MTDGPAPWVEEYIAGLIEWAKAVDHETLESPDVILVTRTQMEVLVEAGAVERVEQATGMRLEEVW